MTTFATNSAREHRTSVFTGADVCLQAGLTLPDDVRRPLFDDDLWDFTEVVGLAVNIPLANRRFDFAVIGDPRWRMVAKELIIAALAPRHPAVAELPRAYRTPLHLRSCIGRLGELTRLFRWLDRRHVTTLAEIDTHTCEAYLAFRRYILDEDGNVVGEQSPAVRRAAAQIIVGGSPLFLTPTPTARHQRTYVLRRYFAWAKAHKHVLVDPARPLRLGAQPAFTGLVLEVNTQRTLFRRWTDQAKPAQERLVGLLALLHAASNAEIRMLTLADLDPDRQTVTLHRRPYPTTMDPATWAAVQACRHEHAATGTLNPHLIVSRVTRSRDTPVHANYILRLLQPARITPSICRQTRLTQLVGDLDPKLAATVLGMQDTGLLHYLADNVDQDRLHHNTSGTIDPTRAL